MVDKGTPLLAPVKPVYSSSFCPGIRRCEYWGEYGIEPAFKWITLERRGEEVHFRTLCWLLCEWGTVRIQSGEGLILDGGGGEVSGKTSRKQTLKLDFGGWIAWRSRWAEGFQQEQGPSRVKQQSEYCELLVVRVVIDKSWDGKWWGMPL